MSIGKSNVDILEIFYLKRMVNKMKNKILTLVEKICTNCSDCRGLDNQEVARELMDIANIPENAEIVEIPLDWNNQVVILFLIPGDKKYYSLFAGIGNDDNFHFDLTVTGILNSDGYFDFFEKEEMLAIDYFDKKQTKEKLYTTYEQTADKETAEKDTRSMHEWFLYYLLWIDRTEYPDFVTWLADMVKSGNLIEEKEEETA